MANMIYPVYVHVGDDTHAHGVTIPDFPGCFSAADRWEELPQAIQEAVEVYFEGDSLTIPAPSSLNELMQCSKYKGGVWLLVDLDLKQIQTKAIQINISLPETLLNQIDTAAKARQLSRSSFLAMAADRILSAR